MIFFAFAFLAFDFNCLYGFKLPRSGLVQLSIVQPTESDPSCAHSVNKNHGRISKLKEEIEHRKMNQLALIRKTFYSLAVGIAIYICGRLIYDRIFPGTPMPQKEQMQLLSPIQDQTTSNLQNHTGRSYGKGHAPQPTKKLK
jgi:cell division protein FtsL